MNKELFIRDLRRFLADLPEDEREQAISYYEDYFEDAGPEMEQQVIEELGSPVDIAKQIKSVNRDNITYGEGSASKSADYPQQYNEAFQQNSNQTPPPTPGKTRNWSQSPGKLITVIVLAILAIPVGIPLISGIFSVAVGLIAGLFSLIFSTYAVGTSLVVSGGLALASSIVTMVGGHGASAVLILGISLILIAVGAFLFWLGIIMCTRLCPAIYWLIVKFFRWLGRGITNFFKDEEIA